MEEFGEFPPEPDERQRADAAEIEVDEKVDVAARAYPNAEVHGLDLDSASIAEAESNAESEGVAGRIAFEQRDAADPKLAGGFDLVCVFETIHDMCDPVKALKAMRSLRAEGGTVLVVDERVADTFTVEVEDGERFQGGWSAVH